MPESIAQISFAKLEQGMEMPHLLDIQTRAFESLLQLDAAAHDREDIGLERVFKDLFPITDVHENFSLEFVRYSLGEPKYSVEEGIERVIVSQLHRSPGVVFEESTHPNGQRLISARIIPFRGSWVEFTVDIHDVIYVHIDKKKKFPATALLRAFGYGNNKDIYDLFFGVRDLDLTKVRENRQDMREVSGAIIAEELVLAGQEIAADAPKPKTKKARAEREALENELTVRVGDELTESLFERLREAKVKKIRVYASYMTIDLRDELDAYERGEREGAESIRVLARDVVDPETGEIVAEADQQLKLPLVKRLRSSGILKVQVF